MTFDPNGGTPTTTQTVGVKHGKKVAKSAVTVPTRTDYTFVGWVDKTTGTQFLFDNPVTENIALEANWIVNAKEKDGSIKVNTKDSGIEASSTIKTSDVPMTSDEANAINNEGGKLETNLIIKKQEPTEKDDKEIKRRLFCFIINSHNNILRCDG